MWKVSSQNGLTPFWSIWDIWDLSCWNIKKIIRKFVILLIITSRIFLLYIMRKVSLERYYFVLYDCALTSKISKMALKSFCDKTRVILFVQHLVSLLCTSLWGAERAADRTIEQDWTLDLQFLQKEIILYVHVCWIWVWMTRVGGGGRFPCTGSSFHIKMWLHVTRQTIFWFENFS